MLLRQEVSLAPRLQTPISQGAVLRSSCNLTISPRQGPASFHRSRVFNRLIEQPVEFFDGEEVGALTSRLGADCQSVARALSGNFNVAFRNGLQCLGVWYT